MAGTKRTSDAADFTVAPHSKVVKTNNATSPSKGKKGNKRNAKTVLSHHRFMTNAARFHVNLTRTPPTTDADGHSTASADPGFIGNLTLVPSKFTTGSYGWKGSKRIMIEVQDPQGGSEPDELQVMLTVNATVLGSKQAKSGDNSGEELEETNDLEKGSTDTLEVVVEGEGKADSE